MFSKFFVLFEHRIQDRNEFAHTRRQRLLMLFAPP